MLAKVRKAVFPAAGLGTRFLPATKAQPKEMLALVDKPLIQYGVTPKGWREAAGYYGKAGSFMWVADVKDARSLEKVRSYKKQAKAAAKAAPSSTPMTAR